MQGEENCARENVCLVLNEIVLLNLLLEKKTRKGKPAFVFEKKRSEKKPTYYAKFSVKRLVLVASCPDLGGRETRE